jgi:glycerophosphoryl diester phosphodiesterase
VLQLVSKRAAAGLRGGAYVETKEPAFHDAVGLPLEGRVVAALAQAGLEGTVLAQRIVLQSFEKQVGRLCR